MRHAERLPNSQPPAKPKQTKVTLFGHLAEDTGLGIAKYTLGKRQRTYDGADSQ